MEKRTKILLALALVVVAVGVAAAAVRIQKPLPSTVSIVTSPGLTVLDSSCNTVLNTISYSQVGASVGAASELSVCIKNTGNIAFYLVKGTSDSVTFDGLPAGLSGDWSATNLPAQLIPGDTQTVTITLTNDGSASAGLQSFTTVFTGYDSATG